MAKGQWGTDTASTTVWQCFFNFLRKTGSAWDVSRTNYSKGSLFDFFDFSILSESLASHRLWHRGCQNRTMYMT